VGADSEVGGFVDVPTVAPPGLIPFFLGLGLFGLNFPCCDGGGGILWVFRIIESLFQVKK
jgi:hypothetical protein